MRTILLVLIAAVALPSCSRSSSNGGEAGAHSTRITGPVVEQFDVPPYTYLRIRTQAGDVWAAVPLARIDARRAITISSGIPLENFDTGSGRRLEVVYLGQVETR